MSLRSYGTRNEVAKVGDCVKLSKHANFITAYIARLFVLRRVRREHGAWRAACGLCDKCAYREVYEKTAHAIEPIPNPPSSPVFRTRTGGRESDGALKRESC